METDRPVLSVAPRDGGAIALVELARPPVNALDRLAKEALRRAVAAIGADASIRGVVIASGLARVFCAGSDLRELGRELVAPGAATERTSFEFELWESISQLPQPSIAIIEGHALGSGLELAIACDFRVAGAEACLGLPEVRIGGAPGIQTLARLPALVGLGPARRMLLTGESIGAAEARSLGLVDVVTPAGEALDEGLALARRLVALPESSIRSIKHALHAWADPFVRAVRPAVLGDVEALFTAPEMREGIAAFLEKREPDYRAAARHQSKPNGTST